MRNNLVVFIDSGVGGLSTLSSSIGQLKNKVIYFADNKFAPYGNMTKSQIRKRLESIVMELKNRYSPVCFVLACNTATTSSISFA